MKYLGLIIFSLILFPKNFTKLESRNFFPTPIVKNFHSKEIKELHKSLITGNKTGLPGNIKANLKKYGLLHLLTPSGLHLTSIIFLFSFSKYLEIFVLVTLFCILNFYFNAYDSMTRVIIFRLFYKALKIYSPKGNLLLLSFFSTIIISFLMGHYTNNPLSFLYSFVFWGTILTFRKNPILLIILLHIVQILMASITQTQIHPLAIIINPILTLSVTTLYPLIFILSFIPSEPISEFIFEILLFLIKNLNYLDNLPVYELSITTIIFAMILMIKKHLSWSVLILCLNINSTQKFKIMKIPKIFVSIPPIEEILYQKKNKLHFIDRVCEPFPFSIKCKKMPSHLGGPKI